MSRRIIFSMIGAGAMLIGSASEASAFELFERMLGGGYYGAGPGCGCAVEPSCGVGHSCCDAGPSCGRRHHGLFHGLFHRNRGCGCGVDAGCGCAPEPACGIAAAPVCGCAAEPACGCADACNPCGRRHRGLFHGLFHRNRGGCGSACGCAAEPVCGAPVAPVCGCAGY